MPRFLQLHTLTSYPASLLNRDDVGFAKRLPFGGSERVRISSQCLKRHWRSSDGEHALRGIDLDTSAVPMAVRSRRSFEAHVYHPLVEAGVVPEVANAAAEEVLQWVLPEGKAKQAQKSDDEPGETGEASSLRTAQVTVLGEPELTYLRTLTERIAADAGGDPARVRQAAKEHLTGEEKKSLQALKLGAGLDAALFGRMITGDILARCDAAIHVAHSFTVHTGYFETDYFSAIDDLQGREETGSGHINTAELATGLYYGYLVVDLPLLVSNLEGCPREEWERADRSLAGEVVRRLVHLVATVSPGAKLGATAPYAHALAVLAEAGNAQPRTLANAFLDPVRPTGGSSLLAATSDALGRHLTALDAMYGATTERRLAALEAKQDLLAATGQQVNVPQLADWAAGVAGGLA